MKRSTIDRGTRCIGQKRDLGDPSPALSDGCNGLRTRSLKPRRVAVSNRRTVTPLSRAQLLHQVQTRRIRHHPPVIRTPLNGLVTSELRRIFCSDEGALMRILPAHFAKNRLLLSAMPCPAWGWGRKALKAQPPSATRGSPRDHRASTVLPRASMSAAPAIHSGARNFIPEQSENLHLSRSAAN